MSTIKVVSMTGAEVGTVELNDAIFGIEPNMSVVHEVVKNHLANCRQGTQSALTRAEVSGGGRKPWRQKCVREHPPITTEAMQTLMEELKESYDYILVDSPAGIDSGFDLAVCAADKVVVVTTPQVAAVHDADCVLRLLRRKKDISTYLLINSFRKQLVKEGNMLQISDICELLKPVPFLAKS